jgi:hypothetical protein
MKHRPKRNSVPVVIHSRFNHEDVEVIAKVAQMKQITKSEVIRQAVDLYLSLASVP